MSLVFVALLMWLAAIVRVWRATQRPHAAGLRSIAIALVSIAIATTVNVPAVASWFDALVRWPNSADLVKQLTIVIAAAGNQIMLLHLRRDELGDSTESRPARTGIRWALATAICLASSACFFVGGRQAEAAEFARTYAGTPWLSESRLIVTVYAAVILASVTRLCLQQWDRSVLGRGILLLASGAGVMVLYCIARIIFLVGHRLGYAVSGDLYELGTTISKIGLPLVAIGTLLPTVEAWWYARRDLKRLDPLWSALSDDLAKVQVGRPTRYEDLTLVVDHRVVMIQDALYVRAQMAGVGESEEHVTSAAVDRAAAVATWIRDKESPLSLADIRTPESFTERAWCLLVSSSLELQHPQVVPA